MPTNEAACRQTTVTETVWLLDRFGNWSKLSNRDYKMQGQWLPKNGAGVGQCLFGEWARGQVPASVDEIGAYQAVRVVGGGYRETATGKGTIVSQIPVTLYAVSTCVL
jgi:hypothetical protein